MKHRQPKTPHRRHPLRLRLAAALSFALGTSGWATGAEGAHVAQTIVVENCNDSGPGSLREAYAGALDGDVVDLTSLACSTITLTSGPLVSEPDAGYVTLQGDPDTGLTLDGNHAGRVIVHSGTRIGVNGLVVTGGVTHDALGGGCIYSSDSIGLRQTTVRDCEASTSGIVDAKGGGVRSMGGIFLSRSRITGNRVRAAQADADGGGIHAQYVISAFQNTISGNTASGDGSHYARGGGIFASGYLRLDDITVSDNQAESAAGIYVGYLSQFITPRVTNATISGNRASGAAGGIFAGRSIKLYNSTVTGNTAVFDFGAGLYLAAGDAELHSTIVANNSTGDGLHAADIGGHAGALITGAHNLVIASTLALPAGTLSADPMLGPLADNGGPVQTHALLAGSPAIDAGENPSGLYTDERGFSCPPVGQCVQVERTIGPATDIGAFEFGAPDRIFDNAFDPEA